MDDNMRSKLCVRTLKDDCGRYLEMNSTIVHSDHGSQYTSEKYYCTAIADLGIHQSMNSEDGKCQDNTRCKSMWARIKNKPLYL